MAQQYSIILWGKDGCSYCNEVKQYLKERELEFKLIDVTNHDDYRNILEAKYGVRHVPVVEIGKENQYVAVTDVGIEHLQKTLQLYS